MIIFYNKKTGEVVGTVAGRYHNDKHRNMAIGDSEKLIINWSFDKTLNEWVPDYKDKELATRLDLGLEDVYSYRINILDKTLTKI